ncbi:MAG: hypothetical protein COX48_05495 [bacterium (Candidatus Stahlbacteria) CG23_combo_of_CG06-09_8_20_14_all_34_7]|nr:MAG: hypothetical protein COX48_05495 [bacterium (Candidatus Stahlbacteria) CG23_combo_of_CG06-09_8_20_14_all_34_7]
MKINNGIYIHIPFCKSKCSYCTFVSGIYRKTIEGEYFDALIREIRERKKYFMDVDSIYMGGGTPSFVEKEFIEKVVFAIKERYDTTHIKEFTIEMNPESVTCDLIKFYKEIGINRFSVGVQSYNNRVLNLLGRAHRQKEIKRVLNCFLDDDNLSIDLIWGISGFSQNISFIDDYPIKHLSCYMLTLEKESPLFKEKYPEKRDLFIEREYYKLLQEIYKRKFERYEVSNFSKKGFESKHNLSYWNTDCPYIGYGVSAASYNIKSRTQNTGLMDKYIQNIHNEAITEEITEEKKSLEKIMLSLRTESGLFLDEEVKNKIKKERMMEFIMNGSLVLYDNTLICTDKGYLIMNYIIAEILS